MGGPPRSAQQSLRDLREVWKAPPRGVQRSFLDPFTQIWVMSAPERPLAAFAPLSSKEYPKRATDLWDLERPKGGWHRDPIVREQGSLWLPP